MAEQDIETAINILHQLQDGQAQIALELSKLHDRLGRIETRIGTSPTGGAAADGLIGDNPIVVDARTGALRVGTRHEIHNGAARIATTDDLRQAAHERMDRPG